ncbi:hypothetical protein [Myroides odoratus]|uniref:hypothetical protein n=1 Tax=Myroides odoratus TaxID=256 RepID=UPI003342C1D0
MKQGVLNIKVDYKPLDTYKNVTIRSGSNRQNYNANTRYFEPDRRIDPYVVLVQCGVNDVHNIVSGLVNANLTDVSWKQSTPAGYKEILTTDTEFKIGTGADKGKLSIFKNVSDLEPVTILFSARFMDNTTKRVVNFQESFNLITLPIAESPILLETSAPVGYNLFPTENNQGLICQADLYRGKDKVPAAYWWYNGQYEIGNVEGYQGQYTNKLFIDASKINKSGTIIKIEVADCSEYLNGLIMDKVDNDSEVIQWRELYQTLPENLLRKSTNNQFGFRNNNTANNPAFVEFDTVENCWYVMKGSGQIGNSISIYSTIKLDNSGGELVESIDVAKGKVMCSMLVKSEVDSRLCMLNASDSLFNQYIFPVKANEWTRIYAPITVERLNALTVLFANIVLDKKIFYKDYKIEYSEEPTPWSPSKFDLQDLTSEKIEYYKSNTSLPENYRPNPKPSKLYTADFMLMKKLPGYTEEILYPTSVSPEASSVQVEMVLNTNNGVIQQPEQFLSVGWLKQANGTFKYKGFKVNISIADIKALNDANKQLDYELREDLTLKP